MPIDKLTGLFKVSVKQTRINTAIIQYTLSFQRRGIKTTIVTNNMDIFNEPTIPEKKVPDVFPVITNSFDHKILKSDQNGILFDMVLQKLGSDSYRRVWLIDDKPIPCAVFVAKGGYAYQHSG